ncbi:MAG: cation:proton antiporter, partial [Deltaproteobacteria bacterium]|nr:cation:proton antiporter [Deltaproteobacteria bacterium]
MAESSLANPALTAALALIFGIISTSLARHIRIPSIVPLLAFGVLLGPDFLNLIQPQALGEGLTILVGFAVSIILFEGGMDLQIKRLQTQAKSIRNLISIGALVTCIGGALAAKITLGWSWTACLLFGTLVIVTGPTVINPLLRRIRVKERVHTVLEGEGIFIDAVGALIAIIALEIAISPTGEAFAFGLWHLVSRLGFGLIIGGLGGWFVAFLLRQDNIIPEGLENTFTLSSALALFQASNTILPESGIMAVIVAGLVVGNVKTRALEELKEFKEQLTVLVIGML